MRTWRVSGIAGSLLLPGPTVLAFFAGGYFTLARVWAGVAVAALLLVILVAAALERGAAPAPGPERDAGVHRADRVAAVLPASRAGRVAVISLAAFAAWTLASIAWAPIAGRAYSAGQLGALYAVGLLAASLALRRSPALRTWLEPALALGVLIVCGYGLAGRMLPGVITMTNSVSANGRLEQPLTYWNAMGELAAIGGVLCARLAGDIRRRIALRAFAAAAVAPLGLALYVSFSRGALYAGVAGLVALIVLAPTRAQIRGLVTAAGAGALAAAACSQLPGFTGLEGGLSTRETQGIEALAAVLVVMLAAAIVLVWSDRPGGALRVWLPRRSGAVATALVCGGLALAIVIGAHETSGVPLGGSASRLTTLQSNRYDYWHVALEAFAHAPVVGVGAGGWSVWWLQKRPYADGATDTHSLELQTLAELGLVGVAILAVFLISTGLVGRAALRRDRAAAAGPLAGALTWLVHSPLDWDWQMPALTLVAVLLAASLIAVADAPVATPGAAEPPLTDGELPPASPLPRMRQAPVAVAAITAAALCAWFVLGVRQAQSQSAAESVIQNATHPLAAAEAAHLHALLNEAGALNPDHQIQLDQAKLLLETKSANASVASARQLQAQAIIRRVTAAEPQNLSAWLLLAQSSSNDAAQFKHAVGEVLTLEPRDPQL